MSSWEQKRDKLTLELPGYGLDTDWKWASAYIGAMSRARSADLPATLTPGEWEETVAHFESKCVYCGSPATTLDHFIPLTLEGGTTKNNVVPACYPCNAAKRDEHPFLWSGASRETVQSIHGYLSQFGEIPFRHALQIKEQRRVAHGRAQRAEANAQKLATLQKEQRTERYITQQHVTSVLKALEERDELRQFLRDYIAWMQEGYALVDDYAAQAWMQKGVALTTRAHDLLADEPHEQKG